jgi:hypothetical protein
MLLSLPGAGSARVDSASLRLPLGNDRSIALQISSEAVIFFGYPVLLCVTFAGSQSAAASLQEPP